MKVATVAVPVAIASSVLAQSSSLCRTSTTISVAPATRILQAASTCTSPGGGLVPTGPYTTIYQTTYYEFCPTGLQPKVYTVTESCSEGQPTTRPTDYVPSGFTTTISECHVCGAMPITATLTIPCGVCAGPTGVPNGTNQPPASAGNDHADTNQPPSAGCSDGKCASNDQGQPQSPVSNNAGGGAGGAAVSPGNSQSGNASPGNAQPGHAQPGNVQPGNAQPGNAQPGNAQPGSAQSGSAQPGNAQPGNAQPGNAQSGSAQSGSAQSGNAQSPNNNGGKASPSVGDTQGTQASAPCPGPDCRGTSTTSSGPAKYTGAAAASSSVGLLGLILTMLVMGWSTFAI